MLFKNTKLLLATIFVVLLLGFLFRYALLGHVIYGDGIYYYVYTRSLVKDFDLNFRNEYNHRYSPEGNNSLIETAPNFAPDTMTDHMSNRYPTGPGLAWIPPFILADIIANLINFFDNNFPNNGYSHIYQLFVGVYNIVLFTLGLFILYKILITYYDKKVSQLTIFATVFGSNLLFYSSLDVLNSHPTSFMFGAIFSYVLLITKSIYKYFILGIIAGSLALIRTQDAIFLGFILLYILFNKQTLSDKVKNSLISIISFILVFSLQLLSWQIIYGIPFAIPYISHSNGFDFLNPQIIGVLFNFKTGLFLWTPFYIFALTGLLLVNSKLSRYALLIILLQMYLISSWNGWHQGESFGIRMLISLIPFFTLGVGYLFSKLGIKLSLLVTSFLILFNFSAILYFLLYSQSPTYNLDSITQNQIFERLLNLFN